MLSIPYEMNENNRCLFWILMGGAIVHFASCQLLEVGTNAENHLSHDRHVIQ